MTECVRCDDCERLYMDQQKCPHWIIIRRKSEILARQPASAVSRQFDSTNGCRGRSVVAHEQGTARLGSFVVDGLHSRRMLGVVVARVSHCSGAWLRSLWKSASRGRGSAGETRRSHTFGTRRAIEGRSMRRLRADQARPHPLSVYRVRRSSSTRRSDVEARLTALESRSGSISSSSRWTSRSIFLVVVQNRNSSRSISSKS